MEVRATGALLQDDHDGQQRKNDTYRGLFLAVLFVMQKVSRKLKLWDAAGGGSVDFVNIITFWWIWSSVPTSGWRELDAPLQLTSKFCTSFLRAWCRKCA